MEGAVVTHGGEVGMYIRNDIPHQIYEGSQTTDYELLWVILRLKVLPRKFCSIVVGVLYFPPRSSYRREIIPHLQACLDEIKLRHPNSSVVLMGDFNDLLPSWIERSLSLKQVVREKTTQYRNQANFFKPASD